MRLSDRIAHLVVHRPLVLWSAFLLLGALSVSLILWRATLNSDVLDMLPAEFESVQIYKLADREFSAARDLLFGLAPPAPTADAAGAPSADHPAVDKPDDVNLDGFAQHFITELRKEPWVERAKDRASFGEADDLNELRALALPLILNQNDADFAATIAALQPDAIRTRLGNLRSKLQAATSPVVEGQLMADPLGIVFPIMKSQKFDEDKDPNFRVFFVHARQPDLNEPACNAIMAQVEDFKKRVVASWPAANGPAPEILCTGRTPYVSEMSSKLKSDILSTLFGSVFLVGITFYAGFRRWKPLRAIVDALLFSCLLAVGCGAGLFGSLNMITIGLCAILVGLGVDLAMVLYAIYLDELERGHTHEQAIAQALRVHGPGIWFGAFTTAAAFLCLLLSGSPGYRQLGVLIACGILITALVMTTILWILFDIPRWLYVLAGLGTLLGLDLSTGGWPGHWGWKALLLGFGGVIAFAPFRVFREIFLAAGIGALGYLLSTMGSWNTYVWQNVVAGVLATVIAWALVVVLGRLTARLPELVFSRPWKLLRISLPLFLLLAACALLPLGRIVFDIDPKTLEPKPSNAGDALRTIMAHLNPDGMDSVMAVIQSANADQLSADWQKADAAWRKLTPEGAAPGVPPVFLSIETPASFATSPARIRANAQKLAALDFAKSEASFDQAIVAGDYTPKVSRARSLLEGLADVAAGRLNVIDWRQSLPPSSAWWFAIDNLLSRDHPLGIARLKPAHPVTTPADAEALRQAMKVPGVQIGLSGWGFTLAELKPWSEEKMVSLTLLMVGLNIVILTILLRTWRPVTIIMVGLAFSIAGMFVTVKALDLPLNLFNVLAFPLVLGVGVDYSIYATLAVRSEHPHRELTALMKPLLLSGLTTVIGFVTLAWSYNPALRGLGLLCGLGVGWCLLTALVFVLPLCALWAKKNPPAAS